MSFQNIPAYGQSVENLFNCLLFPNKHLSFYTNINTHDNFMWSLSLRSQYVDFIIKGNKFLVNNMGILFFFFAYKSFSFYTNIETHDNYVVIWGWEADYVDFIIKGLNTSSNLVTFVIWICCLNFKISKHMRHYNMWKICITVYFFSKALIFINKYQKCDNFMCSLSLRNWSCQFHFQGLNTLLKIIMCNLVIFVINADLFKLFKHISETTTACENFV